MSEMYHFSWEEANQLHDAVRLAKGMMVDINAGYFETEKFDVDFDLAGVSIRIPHLPKPTGEGEKRSYLPSERELERAEKARKKGG